MAKKTSLKKESDKEFLERISKMQKQAEANSAAELDKLSNSKEVLELKERGKQAGAKAKEIEECLKVEKEFAINPPIITSIHVNGKLTKWVCEDKSIEKKIELMKRNNFTFLQAVHNTSIFGITFKAFGKAYVRRGSQKISLPETNEGVDFLLKDADILGTEKGSYIYDIKDTTRDNENDSTNITIFPKSELKLNISEKTTNPAPAFMDPSQVKDAIKRNSKSTLTTQRLNSIELLEGIFDINITRERRDVNNFIKIPSSYPKIRFKSSSAVIGNVVEDLISKMKSQNPKLAALYEAKTLISSKVSESKSRVCDNIAAIIELCPNNSIVILRAGNVIVNESSGKESKMMFTNPMKPVKITITKSEIYEKDTNKSRDARVEAIIDVSMSLMNCLSYLKSKIELEQNLKNMTDKKNQDEAKGMIDEANQMLKDAEEIGDKELIEMSKIRLKTNTAFASGKLQEISASAKESMIKSLKFAEKQIEILKPKIEADFPPYSSP